MSKLIRLIFFGITENAGSYLSQLNPRFELAIRCSDSTRPRCHREQDMSALYFRLAWDTVNVTQIECF